MILLKALSEWDTNGRISKEAWLNLKPYCVEDREYPIQKDGVGCWGRGNANGPGLGILAAQVGAGENTYIAPRESYASDEEYYAAWDQPKTGDFMKLFWNENIGGDRESDIWEAGITDPGAFDNAKNIKPDDLDLWLYAINTQHLATEEEMLTAIKGEKPDFEFTLKPGYGKSEIYEKDELKAAADKVLTQFRSFEGCEMRGLKYAGDDCNTDENLARMNALDKGKNFVQVAEFLSDFRTPSGGSGPLEPDKEYFDYQWWLARTEGGEWQLLTWGY